MSDISTIKESVATGTVEGHCHARFDEVRQEFVRNFQERDEVGGSVSIILNGETAVDLWGGSADPTNGQPWTRDTLCLIWSSTKGATSLCAHLLIDRGQLDINAPVARYWPEFAQEGKEAITVKMVLSHQSGVAAISEPLPQGAFFDWDLMIHTLERQKPFWQPGTRHGYHSLTYGWLVGELVRRVSGKSLGTFFRTEVAEPLGLDFWIGFPDEHKARLAPIIPAPPAEQIDPTSPAAKLMTDPNSLLRALIFNIGGYMSPDTAGVMGYNQPAALAAEIPAANGIANARALAGMYAPLANDGSINGVRLVGPDTLARMGSVIAASEMDASLFAPLRFSAGFFKSLDNRHIPRSAQDNSVLLSEEAFGFPGAGGSIGFADPGARMSFGYTMNRMGAGIGLNSRGQSLVDAAYRALGYTSNASGCWIKA